MKVVVLGAGESGIGAALLAKKLNHEVFVSDAGVMKEKYREELINNKIDFEESGHTFDRLAKADIAIISPGIPAHVKPITVLTEAGVEMVSEIEYGYRYGRRSSGQGKIIGITGSNGKTTTTGLTYHMMHTAGLDVAVGGNYGISYCRILAERNYDYYVLELSSFQLERVPTFRPDIAMLLNISPDHLDRYDYNMDLYVAAKMNLIENLKTEDTIIYNGDDTYIQSNLEKRTIPSTRMVPLSTKDYINGLASKDASQFFLTTLSGKHNLFNARCAIEACRVAGLTEEQIADGLATFTNAPHRMELVATIDDVQYINDSKATNVDAVYYALDALETDIIWVAGGVDKGNDYNQIAELVNDKVKYIIALTKYPEPLLKAFSHHSIEIFEETTLAVRRAEALSKKGDTVLLSPACASFDLFANYEDRGNKFKEAVHAINADKK